MVDALLDTTAVVDRQARALLIELIGDVLGQRVFPREQPNAQLYAVEIVRLCASLPGGLSALASALELLEGRTRATETFTRLVAEAEPPDRPEPRTDHPAATPQPPPRPEPDGTRANGTPTDSTPARRDFFVSYTSADREWAAWIAWQLEEAGFSVLMQDWDFVPGTNWQFAMDRGLTECDRIIAVLTPAYLKSVYARLEAHVAQAEDPAGLARRLVPVRVAPVTPTGLLHAVVYVDLVGLPTEEARARLLSGVGGAHSGRAKPAAPPGFPG
nr:toll/interleukin-1 receptor domain-containing protein [Streptomyces sp. SID13726]